MPTLFHETNIETAYALARNGVFFSGPILGDAGLNVTVAGRHSPSQVYEATGAMLEFEWTGPVVDGSTNPLKIPLDTLCTEGAWRGLLLVGTSNHLVLTSIHLTDGVSYADLAVAQKKSQLWWAAIPGEKRKTWQAERASDFREIAAKRVETEILEALPLNVVVRIRPDAPYRSMLFKARPDVARVHLAAKA